MVLKNTNDALNIFDKIILKLSGIFFKLIFFILAVAYGAGLGLYAPVFLFFYPGFYLHDFGINKWLGMGISFVLIGSIILYVQIKIPRLSHTFVEVFSILLELANSIDRHISRILYGLGPSAIKIDVAESQQST